MKTIHINCDLGEGGKFDAELMPLISACNIACGGHAGNEETMQKTIQLAKENGVEVGAHPSFPDKKNFGRKSLEISAEDLKRSLVSQLSVLKKIAASEGVKLSHVKPHGALYNDAARDEKTAKIVIDSVLEFDENLPLFVPLKSVISDLAKGKIPIVFEAFADRNYEENYSLVSRSVFNALITEKEEVFDHLFLMFSKGKIRCKNGAEINCKANTFCLHSDTPNSVEILKFLHQKFAENNLKIKNT